MTDADGKRSGGVFVDLSFSLNSVGIKAEFFC
jgi:hypothetical protein